MNAFSVAMSALLLAATTASAAPPAGGNAAHPPLEKVAPWPQASAGMSRHVIWLPSRPHEENIKLELMIGQTLEVDCNHTMLAGTLSQRTLPGWGYDYLVLEKLSPPAATLMGCPDQSTQRKFIAANLGDAGTLRYNSRLPIVVYVPEGTEVKYRLWHADDRIQRASVE